MPTIRHEIRQCEQQDCRFRFPAEAGDAAVRSCPYCGGSTRIAAHSSGSQPTVRLLPNVKGPEVEALLDNIRSVYNVGSIFRTADGAGIRHLHLCGITATPEHAQLAKTGLGAQEFVRWSYHRNGVDAIRKLKQAGFRLWALEGGQPLQDWSQILGELQGPPILLVVGNERAGIDPGIVEECDRKLSLPMLGHKNSLNVVVAFGVAAYSIRFGAILGPSHQ